MPNPASEEFDWDAFMRDTNELSLAAVGGWFKCLYKMRFSVTRGRISMPLVGYARMFGSTVDQAKAVIDEITMFRIGDAAMEHDNSVTLTNRRMYRDWEAKEANRIKQLQFRRNKTENGEAENNGNVTENHQTPHLNGLNPKREELDQERIKTKRIVESVFAYWQSFLNHPQAKLTSERRRAIEGRVKDGYSEEDIKRAVNGCKQSSYHQGQNDQGKIYDDIELICRNGTKMEQFISYLTTVPKADVGKYIPNDRPFIPEPCDICHQDACFSLHEDERRAS